ncbi:MAG: DNA repair protein RadA [Bacteroidales bacterium]|jgi:DNA repair protein RadA/Sms|nr:DNA repair protein RadA [Bacteroidales bacterium]
MAKLKTAFFCRNCGAEASKWTGRCPACGEWNTYVEETVEKKAAHPAYDSGERIRPQKLSEISALPHGRIDTLNGELNRALGGGLVPGSLVLLGGEPGIGKSTLALQIALQLKGQTVLYVSGEESLQQIKMRAERIGEGNGDDCLFLNETSLEAILTHCREFNPGLLFIDSIQTISTQSIDSSAGSVSQIRECTATLLKFAKMTHTSVFLIGHITKDGILAGPKVLEHIVDTVLQFEGDHNHVYRILRSLKNRFGATSELGIFEMRGNGLREVGNPSEMLITANEEGLSGIGIGATVDGVRPFLIEVQALVSSAVYGTPQRSCIGFDARRLNMLLAVLEKRAGFRLSAKDVFLNIAGGLKVDDPAIDMAVIAAIMSSNIDTAIRHQCCFSGEVGLSGEIRPVSRIEQRIQEAQKLGFTRMFVAGANRKGIDVSGMSIEVVFVSKVEHLFKALFGKNS